MDIQRFRQVLAYIEANPNKWNQTSPFEDASAYCFGCHCMKLGNYSRDMDGVSVKTSIIRFCAATYEEADWLYDAFRTLDDFRTIARRPFA